LYKRENEDIEAYKKVYKKGYKEESEEYDKEGEYNKLNLEVTLSAIGSSLLALFC
jgi:hypothetical protein